MSIFNRKKRAETIQGDSDALEHESLKRQSIRFPWEAFLIAGIGLASEVVDAMLMSETLSILTPGLEEWKNILISYIIGGGCFFSMAFVGFQLGNPKHYTSFGEKLSYGFWFFAGLSLVAARLLAGMTQGTTTIFDVSLGDATMADLFATEEFVANLIVAIVQFVLYIGTGFMTRDSIKILTENNMREYFLAKRRYRKLLDELSEKRGEIMEDISKLQAYPKFAERIVKSEKAAYKNVEQYNQAARALIETRMSVAVEPELMESMYDNAMKKEKNAR